jgi:hypothetical protein
VRERVNHLNPKNMKGKKTVEVSVMLDWANAQLARTDVEANASYKAGICDMLYVVLSKSNNYKGFRYINPEVIEYLSLGYFSRIYY